MRSLSAHRRPKKLRSCRVCAIDPFISCTRLIFFVALPCRQKLGPSNLPAATAFGEWDLRFQAGSFYNPSRRGACVARARPGRAPDRRASASLRFRPVTLLRLALTPPRCLFPDAVCGVLSERSRRTRDGQPFSGQTGAAERTVLSAPTPTPRAVRQAQGAWESGPRRTWVSGPRWELVHCRAWLVGCTHEAVKKSHYRGSAVATQDVATRDAEGHRGAADVSDKRGQDLAPSCGRAAEWSASLRRVLHDGCFALDGGRRGDETVSVRGDLTVNIFLPAGLVPAVSSGNSPSGHTARSHPINQRGHRFPGGEALTSSPWESGGLTFNAGKTAVVRKVRPRRAAPGRVGDSRSERPVAAGAAGRPETAVSRYTPTPRDDENSEPLKIEFKLF